MKTYAFILIWEAILALFETLKEGNYEHVLAKKKGRWS
jgi:hypothetical protein